MDQILEDVSEFVKGCLGPLGGSGSWGDWMRDFTIQILGTLILFLVIRFFLWKPITNLMEARKQIIDQELADAKAHHEQAEKYEQELKQKYEESRAEVERILKEAVANGNHKREEIIAEAKEEAARRIQQAEADIAYEVSKQEQDIKNQIVEVAFLAAEKIIGKEVDKSKYLEMVTKIIDGGNNDAK